MSLFNKNKNIGFTLIELTIVVAIIGVLSAIAIPQYSKFQAKAKMSEAKLALAGIFTVELAFQSDSSKYATCLGDMGYNPGAGSGRYYSVGFKTADKVVRVSGEINGLKCRAVVSEGVGSWVGSLSGAKSATASTMDISALTKSGGEIAIAGTAYKAGAVSNLDDDYDIDEWSISQTKVLTHEVTDI